MSYNPVPKLTNGNATFDNNLNVSGISTFDAGVKTALRTEVDGATITFDMDQSNNYTAELGGNRTLAVSNVDAGQKFTIRLAQDATGSRVPTWWSGITWLTSDGSDPTLKTGSGEIDYFGFISTSGGYYEGFHLTEAGGGGGGGSSTITVKEADGTPNVSNVSTIVVSNGTLTNDGGGQVTITTGGGGGGTGSGLPYSSGDYYLQEIRTNSASGVAISGYFESRVNTNAADIVTVSGLIGGGGGGGLPYSSGDYYLQEIRANSASGLVNLNSINTVSGLIPPNTFDITGGDGTNYTIDGMGLNSASDPTMYLHKGHTYIFNKTFSGHPFRISDTDGGSVYQDADGNNIEIGSSAGAVTFEVPQDAPDKLYYYCTAHPSTMKGVIYTTADGATSGYFESRVDANQAAITSNDADIAYLSGIAVYGSGQTLQSVTDSGNTTSNAIIINNDLTAEKVFGDIYGAITFECKNSTGSTITAGTPVYVSGYFSANGKPLIAPASGNDLTKMPAVGMLGHDLAHDTEGHVHVFGEVPQLDTSSFTVGESVYVAPNAGLTNIRPTGVNELVQKIGRVLRSDASQGKILLLGPGRTNDVPNSGSFEILNATTGNFEYMQLTSSDMVPIFKFEGSGVNDTPINLEVRSSFQSATGSGTALLFQGTQGQLFSITDNLSSGTIFNVSDITGLPMLEVTASGDVEIGEFADNITIHQPVLLSGGVPTNTTNKLYNNNGSLYFNGSSLGYDDTAISGYFESRVDQADADIISSSGYFEDNILELVGVSGIDVTSAGSTVNISAGSLSGYFENHHITTAATSSSNNSGRTYIQDVLLDSYGHVTGIATAVETVTDTDTTYSAGSGLTLVGTEFNIYGGSGHFDQILFQDDEIQIGTDSFAATGISIGYQAGSGFPATNINAINNIFIGKRAGAQIHANTTDSVYIGRDAGYDSYITNSVAVGEFAGKQQYASYATFVGPLAGNADTPQLSNNSSYAIGIGYNACENINGAVRAIGVGNFALRAVSGDDNIEITTKNTGNSFIGSNSNKINLQETIIGDTSSKLLAIGNVGSADLTPDATLEVKPNATTDVGIIVQAVASHSVNLQEWQDSSEVSMLAVGPDGGLVIPDNVPATTTNKLYNNAGTLTFNGSAVGGGGGSSYTAGSGLTLSGTEFNVYGGSGNFEYIELTTNNTVVPKIEFTGSGVTDTPIRMKVLSSHASASTSGTALSFEGTQGQLFGITDNLSSGTIFSVNDITGLPMIEVDASGDVKVGRFANSVVLYSPSVSGSVQGNLDVTGAFSATTKSFLIDHPSKEGMRLQYASLEGPENGVYVRGTTDEGFITLPDYWRDLVHNGSITVTLTPVGQFQPLFVEQKSNREIRVGGVCGYYDYVVYGERKDVDKLEVEW